MLYREFSNTGKNLSQLGFGCMRFPLIDKNDPSSIDKEKANEMLEYALANGVNYFDTAYTYHGSKSEDFVGEFFDGRREDIYLATKFPTWLLEKEEDFDRIFAEQLKKLRTDYVDFYLIHSLSKGTWELAKKMGVMKFIERIKKTGKVKHIGFSFHDSFDVFKEIIDCYDWDFCQIQYNYVDTEYQAGTKGLRYAESKGIKTVIMEPIRGGTLALKAPDEIQKVWDEYDKNRTQVDWALRFVLDDQNVMTVLSGMSHIDHVKENVNLASTISKNSLNAEAKTIYKRVSKQFDDLKRVPCTACGYCMPCPEGVNIPKNFEIYNLSQTYDDIGLGFANYESLLSDSEKANKCIRCNKCIELCPQHIQVPDELVKVHLAFDECRD